MRTKRRKRSSPRTETGDHALATIRALVDALYRSARGVEAGTGLTNAQLAILSYVATESPLTVNEIAERVRTGQSTVSTILSRLARRRLIRRVRATDDRRHVMIEATPAGRSVVRTAPRPPTVQLMDALDALTAAERRLISRALSPLLKRLHRERRRPPMLFE